MASYEQFLYNDDDEDDDDNADDDDLHLQAPYCQKNSYSPWN